MTGQLRLDDHLQRYCETGPQGLAVAAAVDAIATAAIEIADLIATGDLADASGLSTGRNSDGDLQRDLDVQADAILRRCLGTLPIAALATEAACVASVRCECATSFGPLVVPEVV